MLVVSGCGVIELMGRQKVEEGGPSTKSERKDHRRLGRLSFTQGYVPGRKTMKTKGLSERAELNS